MKEIKEYLEIVDKVIERGPYKDNWDSLSNFEIPKWYSQGRFGLFIHWGVYSVPATFNEWYPRLTYIPTHRCYKQRIQEYGKDCEYSDIVKMFKPDKFNADEWLDLFKKSGAKYIMPVGEHHDGIKMYESQLNHWNMWELNGKDYMKEIHEACDKVDMGFCISNHRAEHYWFLNTARKYCKDSEIAKNEKSDLYGPARLTRDGSENIYNENIEVDQTWLEDWLASACEMIDQNKPLAVYFDWWIMKSEFKPYVKKFLAYYYNRGKEWKKEVAVFYKWRSVMNGCAIFDVERGQIDNVSPKLWQNDTAIAKNSWGYTKNNRFKTCGEIIRNMVDVISKNGCYMLNVGPMPDGRICEEEKQVLLEIGKWLEINGEAIYPAKPFEVTHYEGKKHKTGSFKENIVYSKGDYCFTYNTGAVYVFPMHRKTRNEYKIKCLRYADDHGCKYNVTKVEVLGLSNKVNFKRDSQKATITIEGELHSIKDAPICIKVSID